MDMKKIFAALLVLALALVLLPAPTARAEEYTDYEVRDPGWPSDIVPVEGSPIAVAIFGLSAESHDGVYIKHVEFRVTSVGADTATCTSPGEIVCTATGVYEGHTLSVSHTYVTPALGHDLVHHDARPATCTTSGTEAYWKCTRDGCGKLFSDADGENETSLEALTIPVDTNAHSWSTDWTWDDKEHWYPCTNEGCEAKQGAAAHEPEIEPGKPATCTEEGMTDATFCSVCGAPISEQEIIEPLGHQLTPVAKVEATCTAPGTEAYWKCTRDGCGKLFSDADGKNEITAPVAIEALGHDWATELTKGETTHYYACSRCDERKDEAAHTGGTATCKAKAKCSVCGAEYGDFAEHVYPANVWWGDENEHWHVCNVCDQPSAHEAHSGGTPTCTEKGMCEICGSRYVNALGHEIVFTEPVYPTCTAPGTEAYWQCTRCDKLFSDAEGKNETSLEALTIPALGHDWATELTKGEATHYYACSRCDERKDEAAHTGGTATCKAKAKCSVCGAEYGDFAEHVYPANVWWGDENEHWHVCNVCGQDSPHEAHAGGTATCTEPARCDACGNLYGEPLGHDYDVVARVDGAEIYECPRCKYRYTKKIANNTSEPLDDLVQDQAGQAVPYRMEAVDTPAGKAVVVTPYVDQSGQMANQYAQQIASGPTLCLTQEVVKKWLTEGFKFTWFVNGEATLEIELDKLSNFFDSDERFLFTIWSNGKELDLLVHALMATASVPVTDLNGLTLRIGDTTVDMTLDAEGKFTYTLVS